MPNRPGYFGQYYEEHRDDINSKRKQRYHEDGEYRDRVLKASRNYRDRNRVSPRVRMPRFQTPLIRTAGDGGELILFSVGAFASHLSRSVQSINHWEGKPEKPGVLPKTPYRDDRGFRYYTPAMMAVVKEVVGGKRRLFPVDAATRDGIERAWRELGVPVGAESMEEAVRLTVTPQDVDGDIAV